MVLKFQHTLRSSLMIVCLTACIAHAETAPDFTANRLDRGKFHLQEHLKDGYILLHFWDTCCPGCREALPAVQKIADTFKDSLQVIGISTDSPKSQAKIKPFLKTNGYSFVVLLDPNLDVRKLFGGTETPLSVLIGPSGKILLRRIGAAPDEEEILRKEIQSAIHPSINPIIPALENH